MATGGQLEATSEEFIEYECTVCLKNNKIKNAARYCFDCQKYMCPECLQIHNNFGDKHNVLSVTDKRVQNVLTEKCEDHPDKVLEYYCRQHDVVVCQACLLDHRKCENVKHIGESVAELSADPDIQAIPGQIDSALDHVNQIIETFDKHIMHIERDKHTFLEDLEEFAKSILSKIEEMRKRGKDDLTASHQRITSKANEKRNACVQAQDDLSKYSDEIKRSSKRNAHLIVLKNRSKNIAIQTETLCNESKQMIKETAFCFRRNSRLSGLLAEFNSLLEESSKPIKQLTLHFNTRSTIKDEKGITGAVPFTQQRKRGPFYQPQRAVPFTQQRVQYDYSEGYDYSEEFQNQYDYSEGYLGPPPPRKSELNLRHMQSEHRRPYRKGFPRHYKNM